ncbi:predicted protein [Arabidopsis lyrata subsp. lyrata]|uniref:Predicted protein n=1 Tax=Arabidopsis lyrata subsp. lyrata TaxID=81972 RepID=D7KTN9_ARALL|nr:predicted protein [Arabidopsis lyrata subsp. lyrata]
MERADGAKFLLARAGMHDEKSGILPDQTANDVKNYYNTNLDKKKEMCCKRKMRKREATSLATTRAEKINVIRLRPRSFSSGLSGQLEVGLGEGKHQS